jgi:hypothetical protein
MEAIKDCPHIVDLYKHHAKQFKYIPRLYRSHTREEVRCVLKYGQQRRDTYLRLGPYDLGYIYADADRRSKDEEVHIAGWIMDFIEEERPWDHF